MFFHHIFIFIVLLIKIIAKMHGNMIFEKILFCVVLFLSSSLSIPIKEQKSDGAPVNLAYTCVKVVTNENNKDLAPVLMLHGLTNTKESWRGIPLIISFKTGRRVCAADLRNHGQSPWSNVSDVETMASDVKLLLDTLKLNKVILLGHSLGGKISTHFTLTNPEYVEKLIIEDMRPNGVTDEATREVQFFINTLYDSISTLPKGIETEEAKLAVYKYIKEIFEKTFQGFTIDDSLVDFLPIKCSEEKCQFTFNIEVFRKFFEPDSEDMTISSGRFDKPALFIYGAISSFKVGEDKEAILKLFPKAKFVPVQGASHMVHEKSEFVDEVVNFINSDE